MKAVSWFDSVDGRGFHILNDAFITLLPKHAEAVDMGEFRPISLIHSFAKIISKAMAARLAKPLPLLVDHNQSAFVQGRAIQDKFFMVKLSIQALHKKKVPSLMRKLDVANSFDSVSWAFLFEVMQQRGFGSRWLRRVASLLSTSSTRVLVNGLAGEHFWHGRGLWQGDLASPMLFVLVFNTLNALFRVAEEAGLFAPLTNRGIKFRLSFFADDMVFLIKPSVTKSKAAVELLKFFGDALVSTAISPRVRCLRSIVKASTCNHTRYLGV
jgi:hypothetical protein